MKKDLEYEKAYGDLHLAPGDVDNTEQNSSRLEQRKIRSSPT